MKSLVRKISLFIVALPFVFPTLVSAQNLGIPQFPNPSRIDSLEELINIVLGLIRPIFVITFAAMIMYGAFVWMTAQDDDSKIQRARKIIVAAIIGLSIAIFAPVISAVVASLLGVDNINLFGSTE